jgi:hypothetical protein
MVHGDEQTSEAELVAYADGLLPPRRRAQVAARIERSCVRALDSPAPARLRARIRHDLSGVGLTHDELLTLAAWNSSTDIAGIHIGLSPTPLHRLAA